MLYVIRPLVMLLCLLLLMGSPNLSAEQGDSQTINIFVLETMEVALIEQSNIAYQAELSRLMPQTTFNFITANAQGSSQRATDLLTQQLQTGPPLSLIVGVATIATKALVASAETHNIPMQFMIVSDPVAAGVVAKIDQTSEFNMTGMSHVIAIQTKLHLLSQIASKPLRIGLIYSDYPSALLAYQEIMQVQKNYPQFSFVPIKYDFSSGQDAIDSNQLSIINALQAVRNDIDVFWVAPEPAAHDLNLYDRIQTQFAIPQIFSEDEKIVAKGALFGVMCDEKIIGRSAAINSQKILQGMPANAIPVRQSQRFIVAVNIQTALDMNLIFPSSVLNLAKNNIYH